jgi:DmsE family decaheme c-type cytochrome
VHSSEQPLVVRKADAVNTQCASCHLNEWAQFQRPFHHKLPEGAMSCVDCHNPHGSIRPAMLQSFAANEPGCFTCHGDKRGPFTFEHAPVRFEGCQACHEPHGSANPRMLTRADVRFVCLECHANLPTGSSSITARVGGVVPPAFHDLRLPVFQNCTVCHQKIHGSHMDRNLLK